MRVLARADATTKVTNDARAIVSGALIALTGLGAGACGNRTNANGSASGAAELTALQVGAASDLKDAFTEVGARFTKKTGRKVTFTFGSTGLLTKQLKEGAPFGLFAAANASYVDEAVTAGACDGATKAPYARGRLAMWASAAPPKTIADLADARFKRIAIANPEHAPYGKAAEQAMRKAGVWDQVKDRIVKGENVQAALTLATSGEADVALVAYSLVIHGKEGAFALVDAAEYDPIDQALVACGKGAALEGGKAFAEFVNSPEGRSVMRSYGFSLPGEADAPPAASSSD